MTTRGLLGNTGVWGPPNTTPVALWNSWEVDSTGSTVFQVASIAGANLGTGVAVVSATLAASTQGQLWLCVPVSTGSSYNTIVCAENPNLLLTATDAGQVYVAAPLVGPANPAYQQWAVYSQGAPQGPSYSPLVNLATGQALTFGAPGAQLTLQAPSNPLTPNQTWGWTPHNPIDAIINQPPLPFPVFTDDQGSTQGTAYSYINSWIGGTSDPSFDLRAQYPVLDAPLSSYQNDIATKISCPSSVTASDWAIVTDQLNTELTAAIAVQDLFSQYGTFHQNAFSLQSNVLKQLGSDLNMSNSTNVSGVGTALLEGTIYTLLSALPGVGGIVGNLFETGFNAAVAAGDPGASPTPFQYAYSELWKQLTPGFSAVLAQLGKQEELILQDWGMTQQTYDFILQIGGPDSLSWPATYSANCVTAAVNGYSLAALQMLWPTKFWVLRCGGLLNTDTPISFTNAPAGSYWWNVADYFTNLNIYCVIVQAGSNSNYVTFPSASALNDFTTIGGQASYFYPPTGGWSLPVISDGSNTTGPFLPNSSGNDSSWKRDTLLATVVNMSEYNLWVTLAAQEGSVEGGLAGTGLLWMLGPYASMSFASDHDHGLRILVTISTSPQPGGAQVSCQLHLSDSDFGVSENIWVDSISAPESTPNGTLSIDKTYVQVRQAKLPGNYYTCGSVTVPVFYGPS